MIPCIRRTASLAGLCESGFAEPVCVFVTATAPGTAVWFISRHEPEAGFVEMLKIRSEVTACKLRIRLVPAAFGCEAIVSHTHGVILPA